MFYSKIFFHLCVQSIFEEESCLLRSIIHAYVCQNQFFCLHFASQKQVVWWWLAPQCQCFLSLARSFACCSNNYTAPRLVFLLHVLELGHCNTAVRKTYCLESSLRQPCGCCCCCYNFLSIQVISNNLQ